MQKFPGKQTLDSKNWQLDQMVHTVLGLTKRFDSGQECESGGWHSTPNHTLSPWNPDHVIRLFVSQTPHLKTRVNKIIVNDK